MKRYKRTGVLTKAELKARGLLPPLRRLKKGPVVIVECIENIPCNPCAYACPRKAITITGNLTNLPEVNFEHCNGCGICITRCPGLAIFVVNYNYREREATISLPYELLPRPQVGEVVYALNRQGEKVSTAKVIKVQDSRTHDRCAVVTIAVPKHQWNEIRFIKPKGN